MCYYFDKSMTIYVPICVSLPTWEWADVEGDEGEEEVVLVGDEELERIEKYVEK